MRPYRKELRRERGKKEIVYTYSSQKEDTTPCHRKENQVNSKAKEDRESVGRSHCDSFFSKDGNQWQDESVGS